MTSKEIKKYLAENETDVQNANALVFLADLVFRAYVESDSVHGVLFSPVNCYFTGNNKNFYQLIAKKLIRDTAHKVYDDFTGNKKSLDRYMLKHEQLGKKFEIIGKKFIKNTNTSDLALADIYHEMADIAHDWWKYGVIGEDKGEVIAERVVPGFQSRHNLSLSEARNIVSILSHPSEQSAFNLVRKQFLELCLYAGSCVKSKKPPAQNNSEALFKDCQFKKLVTGYQKNNYWMKTDFCDAKEITIQIIVDDILHELQNKSLSQIRIELKRLSNSNVEIRVEKNKVLKKIKLTAKDRADIEFSEKTALWIDRRKRGMMMQFYYFIMLLKEVANRHGMSKDELGLLSVREVSELLGKGKKGLKIQKKLDAFVTYEKGKDVQFIFGIPGNELLVMAKGAKNGGDLKGMVASRGGLNTIQGKIAIILNPGSEKFQDGDILVTSMTRIEYVPLMRKAKAIITNEGGIACHAAIVSRELGLPCIIGTKHATEVLKTGDKVEMNLETGQIDII